MWTVPVLVGARGNTRVDAWCSASVTGAASGEPPAVTVTPLTGCPHWTVSVKVRVTGFAAMCLGSPWSLIRSPFVASTRCPQKTIDRDAVDELTLIVPVAPRRERNENTRKLGPKGPGTLMTSVAGPEPV